VQLFCEHCVTLVMQVLQAWVSFGEQTLLQL
jgi:hypothetical protein